MRNRARLLEVARDLVTARGPAVAIDDIAEAAGVAVGTVYRHFPTKTALVAAVVDDSIEQLADAAEAALVRVNEGGSAGEALASLFRLVAERHSVDAAVKEAATALGAPVLEGGAAKAELAADSPELRAWETVEQVLAHAVTEGSVRPDLTAADLFALVSGVPRDPAPQAVRDRYVDIVLRGVRPD